MRGNGSEVTLGALSPAPDRSAVISPPSGIIPLIRIWDGISIVIDLARPLRGGGVARNASASHHLVGGTTSGDPHVEGVALADEGEVVIATRGIGDGGATVNRDVERGRVQAVAAIDLRIVEGVADADGVTDVATAVDVTNGNGAAVRRCGRHAAVPRGGNVGGTFIPTKELVLQPGLCGRVGGASETDHCSDCCGVEALFHSSPSPLSGCALFPRGARCTGHVSNRGPMPLRLGNDATPQVRGCQL